MPSCDPASSRNYQMYWTGKHGNKGKCANCTQASMSSVKGVSRLSRRTKRPLYCKSQLWMWRKRQRKCCFTFFRGNRLIRERRNSLPCLNPNRKSQKNEEHLHSCPSPILECSQVKTVVEANLQCGSESSEDALRRTKRPLYCKLQMWMWRKRQQKCCFTFFRGNRLIRERRNSLPCLNPNRKSQTNEEHLHSCPSPILEGSQVKTVVESNLQCGSESSEDALKKRTSEVETCTMSQTCSSSSVEENQCNNTSSSHGTPPAVEFNAFADPTEWLLTRLDSWGENKNNHFTAQKTVADDQMGSLLDPHLNADPKISSKNTIHPQINGGLTVLTNSIHDYLGDFFRMYGTFIPLQEDDVLNHLKRLFHTDFTHGKTLILEVIKRRLTAVLWKPASSFRVVFKKHTLTLDDLSTLAHENWLNDQVMNMYGELIMEASQHKVHFINSFFHRQLMTKGYDGVKRWTKQVDLFSKTLLLVPVHLEVHWCLVVADIARRKICLFDSQGNALRKVARNILKYLITEATEKQQTSFVSDWAVSFDENVPKQTNENDCGVFVLEYCRCLALGQPLHFSQADIPKIRKRIYKELCECKLHC
ncbi:uncharacterized protein [Nerophis lumbriciformis]|uniref:uncharacterized protein n=1 Tax=Nerophis lumbriciformis TaxID=546530 RepID=UPI002ADF765A|nr:uncharacterized protein LOC133575810 [Nerophis lumbriciformis]XP_061784649.1 uncharacterized protein LOC133575810 [Nerophis lumbriciformis]